MRLAYKIYKRLILPIESWLCKDLFDVSFYLKTYNDIENRDEALSHYLLHGDHEGRDPFKGFNNYGYRGSQGNFFRLSTLTLFVLRGADLVSKERDASNKLIENEYVFSNAEVWRSEGRKINQSYPIIMEYFDPKFYKDIYKDVEGTNEELFSHFMRYGWKEGRRPNKDFDPYVFADNNPGLDPEKENVFAYYCLGKDNFINSSAAIHGDRSFLRYYLQSSNLFDPLVYGKNIPKAERNNLSGVEHFIEIGAHLGVRSSQHFNVGGIKDPGPESIISFIKASLAGDDSYNSCVQLSDPIYEVEHKHDKVVDVIIPVYDGYDETRRMFSSVLESKNNSKFNLIVVYDAGPNVEILKLLQRLVSEYEGNIDLHIQNENLGFVKTMNNAFFKHSEHDVVILNSDTVVSDHWLDRLLWHTAYNHNVATITPYSNNGTICNFPNFAGFSGMNDFINIGDISDALKKANSGLSVQIPTGVGFCMYMSRKCLNEIGGFDEASFGLGYGEENDWCRRAEAAGFHNIHAQDLFVYHEGGVSFSSQNVDKNAHEENLLKKHPDYKKRVGEAYAFDWAAGYKLRGLLTWLNECGKDINLNLSHGFGGGTEHFINRNLDVKKVNLLVTRLDSQNHLELILDDQSFQFTVSVSELLTIITQIHFNKVYVHHQLGWPQNLLKQILRSLNTYDFVIHDMHILCSRLFGVDSEGLNCGIPEDIRICERCVRSSLDGVWHSDPRVLRAESFTLLKGAQTIHCTSGIIEKHVLKLGFSGNISVSTKPWDKCVETDGFKRSGRKQKFKAGKKNKKVLILGALTIHKGSKLVENLILPLKLAGISIEHLGHVVGCKLPIKSTGAYQKEYVQELISQHKPDVIWIPSVAEETYSFSLSEALNSGLPVVVSKVGVFPQRALENERINLLDLSLTLPEMVKVFKNAS